MRDGTEIPRQRGDDENWKRRNRETGKKEIGNLIVGVHDTNEISGTTRQIRVQKEWMTHCGEKIKKAAMKEGEKTWKKVFFEREEERREWYDISTGRNKEREANEVVLGNFGTEIGKTE